MRVAVTLAAALTLAATGCSSDAGTPTESPPGSGHHDREAVTEVDEAPVTEHGPRAPDVADVTLDGSVDEVGSDAWWADTAVMSWWGNLSEEDEKATCDLADEHGVEETARVMARSMNRRLADTDTPVDVPTLTRWLTQECG